MKKINLQSWNDPTLDDKLNSAFYIAGLNENNKLTVRRFLSKLAGDPIIEFHRQHSIRVGLLSLKIARIYNLDNEELLKAGVLHDVGKCIISRKLLSKADYRLNGVSQYNADDAARMKTHVIYGHEILSRELPITADIIVRHHRYKSFDPYPLVLPNFARD